MFRKIYESIFGKILTKEEKLLKQALKAFLKETTFFTYDLDEYIRKFAQTKTNKDGRGYGNPVKVGHRVSDLYKELYRKWPKWSGHYMFPICDYSDNEDAIYQYYNREHYQGTQLALRKELAQWLIKELS